MLIKISLVYNSGRDKGKLRVVRDIQAVREESASHPIGSRLNCME